MPGLSPPERRTLAIQRTEHLRTAAVLFETICRDEDALPGDERNVSGKTLRYSYLYRADTAYALGDFLEAVQLYDEVAARFPREHSSMTALIQIVNCYSNLGDDNRATTAHRRALKRLNELPDATFEAPDSLLDRDAWERWLENMPVARPKTVSAN
jgi:tetratricopeptide (TPR) repeat protein